MPLSQSCDSSGDAQQRVVLLDDLACEVLKVLIKDFKDHGPTMIAALRENDAKTYLATLTRLLPTGIERDTGGGVMVTTTIDLGGIDG
jgi:hypothetical protein